MNQRNRLRILLAILASAFAVPGVGADPAAGCELAGFIWLQGFNDMVDHHTYPDVSKGSRTNRFAKYSEVLGYVLRDVRKDRVALNMPFDIGVRQMAYYLTSTHKDHANADPTPMTTASAAWKRSC